MKCWCNNWYTIIVVNSMLLYDIFKTASMFSATFLNSWDHLQYPGYDKLRWRKGDVPCVGFSKWNHRTISGHLTFLCSGQAGSKDGHSLHQVSSPEFPGSALWLAPPHTHTCAKDHSKAELKFSLSTVGPKLSYSPAHSALLPIPIGI